MLSPIQENRIKIGIECLIDNADRVIYRYTTSHPQTGNLFRSLS